MENALITLAVNVPSSITDTINNFLTAGQIIGGALAGFFLVIAAIQFIIGGKNNVEMGKVRIICIIVGLVILIGATAIKAFVNGLIAF